MIAYYSPPKAPKKIWKKRKKRNYVSKYNWNDKNERIFVWS